MPGGSFCCIVGCSASSSKCRGLSFHALPKKGIKDVTAWRNALILSINRIDKSFNADTAKICSRHFKDDCFIVHQPSGRRTLKVGSIPTCYMPLRSVELPPKKARKPPKDRRQTEGSNNSNADPDHNSPAETIPCPGITDEKLQCYANLPPRTPSEVSSGYYLHAEYQTSDGITTCTTTIRAQACTGEGVLGPCSACLAARRLVLRKHIRQTMSEKTQLRKFSPLSKISKPRIANALKIIRMEKSHALKELSTIKTKLKEESVQVTDSTHKRLCDILIDAEFQKDSFIQKFWQEQQKAFSRKSGGLRWHPMMVKFAILIHSQSPSAYRSLREIGVLKLPAESTLRDYTNYVHPKSGFQMEVFEELQRIAAQFDDNQRWVCLLHDEIVIKSGLVYDHRSGELVGFIDEAQRSNKSAQEDHLATHALVFMVVGISSNIKMSIGYFPTRTATADEIFPLLWSAVGLLECVSNLKVIASTSDKASPNQRLIRLHDSIYKAQNLFAPERFLYFFSDAPHLVKTVRNNLASSGGGKNTKRLWNEGSELLWDHISRLYEEDCRRQLRRTRLTAEHVNLTPQSVMRVYLAAQVLSNSVGRVLQVFGGPECQETAKFILLMDKFFDCLNVRSVTEGVTKANAYVLPFRRCDDDRFRFLADDFLGYIEKWRASVLTREGFSKSERNRMFLTHQTYEGLKTTVHSVIEATQFLLQCGLPMVLTNKFCQDPLESHFGRHRCMGIRAENPTLWTFGYQENKLRIQRNLALAIQPRGNVRHQKRIRDVKVDDTPLSKIKRKH